MRVRTIIQCVAFLIVFACFVQVQGGDKSAGFDIHFTRGDINVDGKMDLSDAIYLLTYLYVDGDPPPCFDSADLNDNGKLDLADGIMVLVYLYSTGAIIPEPFEACGHDPTPDNLSCNAFSPCEYESLVANYDLLTTLAGTGNIRTKEHNGWSASFEGGPAVDAELSRPHNALADGAGNVYIADKDAHAIRKVSPDGIITTVAGTNIAGNGEDAAGPGTERSLRSPNGIWVKEDGTVFILDIGNAKVRRLSPDGVLTTLFHDPAGMYVGRGLWVSEDEETAFYVNAAGQGVNKWTASEGIASHADGFIQLGNLVVDEAGRVLVTDRGANRVYRVSADGETQPIAGNGSSFGGGSGSPALETAIYGVRGIGLHPLGGYLLATHEGSQIWYVDTSGIIHLVLDGRSDHSHSGDGQHFQAPGYKISEARSVSVDFSGNIIITENDYGYIRMISRDLSGTGTE